MVAAFGSAKFGCGSSGFGGGGFGALSDFWSPVLGSSPGGGGIGAVADLRRQSLCGPPCLAAAATVLAVVVLGR